VKIISEIADNVHMRVLVIRIGRLGDTILATPVIEVLQQAFGPDVTAADYVVLNPGFSGILKSGYRSHRSWPVEYWADLIGST
jgi:ADP-heptose:LPS heptosyltransferase